MTEDRAEELLSVLSDSELLAMIRKGDVSLLAGDFLLSSYGYWQKNNLLRGEAARRGVL